MKYRLYLKEQIRYDLGIKESDGVFVDMDRDVFEGNSPIPSTIMKVTIPGYPTQEIRIDGMYEEGFADDFDSFCKSWLFDYFRNEIVKIEAA